MRCSTYKLQRRDELDREIERLARAADARTDGASAAVLPRDRVARRDGAGDRDRRLAALPRPTQLAAYLGLVSREDSSGDRERKGLNHEGGEQPLSPRPDPSGVELSPSPADQRRSQTTTDGAAAGRDRARLESAAAIASAVHASRVSETAADRGRGRGARTRRLSLGGDAGASIRRRPLAKRSRPPTSGTGVWSAARGASTREGVMRIATQQQDAISPCLECASSRRIHFLPRCRGDHGDRRISAGLTVDATADPRHSSSLLTTAQSYQRPSSAASESNKMRAKRASENRSTSSAFVR